jgi:primosomal replication protein N
LNPNPINKACLSGVILEQSALRYTPAGIAILTMQLNHYSQVIQADTLRTLQFNVEAIGLGDIALTLNTLLIGESYTFEGFWTPVHYKTQRFCFQILALFNH